MTALMRHNLPFAQSGQTIGLLGGSFDPPHAGHVHITKTALKRFGLDRVWWLVSPGNPLKANGPAPITDRVNASRALMQHPRVDVTDVETHIGTRYTADTIAKLRAIYHGVNFVWLMGADNLVQFDQWDNWHHIAQTVPIGVIARPGDRVSARTSKAAKVYRDYKISGQNASLLGQVDAPAWCFVNAPMLDLSSSAIRARGEWNK